MELQDARTLVVGGTGVLGGALTSVLHQRGARIVATGRDAGRLSGLADKTEATLELDLLDVAACRDTVARAAEQLGGLDLLVIASGVAAFGAAADTADAVTEEVFAVNTLGPIAVLSAAVPKIEKGGAVVVLSAILADSPMAGMASYSASKSALSGYLSALRREVRRQGVNVIDVRPPHMDTGLVDRAISGTPPPLPPGHEVDELVSLLVTGVREDKKELVWDPGGKAMALR